MRIGVDTGGTFTDCVVLEGSKVKILKVFSTMDDAARSIREGVRRLSQVGGRRGPLDIIHGTTVGTNSLLERRGARVALVTTAGFEDLIEIGRQVRPRLYDLNVQREPPLVPSPLRWGVKERTAADGKVLRSPTSGGLGRLRRWIKHSRAESIALCFLFSFANSQNEREVTRSLRDLGLPVSVSHEILPEFREYERLSTVVINAFLAPSLGAYLDRLRREVGEGFYGSPAFSVKRERRGGSLPRPLFVGEDFPTSPARAAFPLESEAGPSIRVRPTRELTGLPHHAVGRIYVMQSSGGITTAARASREPVRTILSGPAGGVVAAAWLKDGLGIQRAISFDMGGTSTDVCLIDGRPRTTAETSLGGLPVAVPVIDIHSVGAGGGSVARLDAGGALRVGPQSAGAVPGPICYSRGGTQPTVTDAHLLLGRLDPDCFLGGTYRLDGQAAERGFREFLRRQGEVWRTRGVGFATPLDLARGIISVSNATMEKALRVISVERGHDPRDFSLIAFGGAGGLHAADLARSLGLARVIVPPNAGAFSAYGLLLSDIVKDVSQSVLLPVPAAREARGAEVSRSSDFQRFLHGLEQRWARLERAARVELAREGFRAAAARAERRLDVRYFGQAYELSVPFTPRFHAAFQREHQRAYGYADAGRPLEIVNLQLRLFIKTPKPRIRARPTRQPQSASAAIMKRQPVWFGERFWPTAFYDRERLGPGARLAGPLVVVEYSSTTVVPPQCFCRVDGDLNLVLSWHAR